MNELQEEELAQVKQFVNDEDRNPSQEPDHQNNLTSVLDREKALSKLTERASEEEGDARESLALDTLQQKNIKNAD